MAQQFNPQYDVVYGPGANCTLAFCPVEASIYQYRPALGASISFIVLFFIALVVHLILGVKWRTWAFTFCMACGCIVEMVGYGGRIILYQNPFSFGGFMIQICCITLGPTFFSAAIYLTLSKIIIYLGPSYARFPPKFYYWFFIPCDILSLILQGCGGALSSLSSGGSNVAVDVSITGLTFQVFTFCIFIGLALEYAFRYRKSTDPNKKPLDRRYKIFLAFLSTSILLILIRCAYRIDELNQGYSGPLVHNEGLFIGLEGVMIIIATFTLAAAHPGPVFGWPTNEVGDEEKAGERETAAVAESKTSLESVS